MGCMQAPKEWPKTSACETILLRNNCCREKKRNFKVDIDLICERISRSDILTHILTTQSLLEMRILVTVTKFFMVIIETNRIIANRTDQY